MTAPAKPLGVLLVGYDGAGIQNHQFDMYEPSFVGHPVFSVVGVTDDPFAQSSRTARSRDAAQRLGVPYFEDIEAAIQLPYVDVLSVCVAFERRVAVIELAASHHKHVLVDKPMALTLEDVDRIIEVTGESGIVCVPAHHHRFKDSIRDATRTLAEGRLGTLRAVHADFLVARGATRATSDDPTVWPLGELMNFALYPIDTIRHMTGLEVERVHATRGGFFYGGPDDEDFGVLTLTLEDGVIATVSVGRVPLTGHLAGGEHRYRLVGSAGLLLVDAQETIGVLHGRDRARRVPSAVVTNSVMGLLDEIARAVHSASVAVLGAVDARSPLAVTLAARQSADSGTVLDL
ncbi:MAG: Gfo/Idh/MocA family oxidoreductase [Acidimicrobiia bacterium]